MAHKRRPHEGVFPDRTPRELTGHNYILDEEGRFFFKCFPQGLSLSSDMFNHLTNHTFMEINGTWLLKVIDDIIVFGRTIEECYRRFEEIIKMMENMAL